MRICGSPAGTRPTMWAFVGNASTGRPFPCPVRLSGDPQHPAGARVDVNPGHLAFPEELEAVGAGDRIVLEAEVVAAVHLRDDPALDLARGQGAPGLHVLARIVLVALRGI